MSQDARIVVFIKVKAVKIVKKSKFVKIVKKSKSKSKSKKVLIVKNCQTNFLSFKSVQIVKKL